MNVYRRFKYYSMAVLTMFVALASCEDDYQSNSGNEALLLTSGETDIKAPGNGQYRMEFLTGMDVAVAANIASSELRTLMIMKTIDLVLDESYGNNGVLTVDRSSFDSEYMFNYKTTTDDADKLVAFTFQAVKNDGSVLTSDLTLVVTYSPRDNLSRRKWLFTSKIWVDAGNVQDIKECEKDNYLLFNDNHTMSELYGAKTGAGSGGCEYDGLNVYDSWTLSDDEKFFTMKYHGLFTPDNIQTDVYRVKTLTTEKLELEIDFDLSWLGLGTAETFVYEYKAQPK